LVAANKVQESSQEEKPKK